MIRKNAVFDLQAGKLLLTMHYKAGDYIKKQEKRT